MSAEPHELHDLDDVDRQIIALLRRNGRATNQDIARSLNMAAATVSARVRRLEQTKAMKVVAVTDFAALGYQVLLAIGVEVENRPAADVAADLARLPEVFAAHLVTGARDVELLVALKDFDDLHNFVMKDIAGVKGIRNVSCAIATEVVKFDFDVAPIN